MSKWHQFLSKLSSSKHIDFDSNNMEHRQQIKPPISFESACKSDELLLNLSTNTIEQMDKIQHCIPGQFSMEEHLKATYYDSLIPHNALIRWNNLIEIQTDCTVRWIQNKFQEAASKSNWHDEIWYNAQNERNNFDTFGVCDGNAWFKFIDTLNIGPHLTHPWTPILSAFVAKEIVKYISESDESEMQSVNILDVGCGVGEFGTKLIELVNTEKINVNIDGIDRSINSLNRIDMNVYRCTMNIDLCNITDGVIKQDESYDIIVSSDCLQMTYGTDYCPGSKAVQDLMNLVKPNGYFLIVNTLQTPATYKVVCMFHDILKEKWLQHGFECIADLVVRGFGDVTVEYNDEYEKNSIENNICFVKLMKLVE